MAIERIEPNTTEWDAWYEGHLVRYMFALKHLRGTDNVLDTACGVGYGSAYLAEHAAADVVGIDRSPHAISLARKHFSHPRASFSVDDCHTLEEAQRYGPFNAVVSFETIEHLPRPQDFLKRCYKVLLPGGLLIASTPNVAVTKNRDWEFHEQEYTAKEFTSMLQNEGFSVVQLFSQLLTLTGRVHYYFCAALNKIRYSPLFQQDNAQFATAPPIPTRTHDYAIEPTTVEACARARQKGPRIILAVARKE